MNEGMRLDRLQQSELDDFEEFRKQAFNYTYYCPRCIRSFDSAGALQGCKFCNGPVMEIWSKPSNKAVEKNYRYFCTKCEKNYVANAMPEVCEICGSKFIHAYEWRRMKRDIFRTRFKKFSRRLKNPWKIQIPKQKDATGSETEKTGIENTKRKKFSLKDLKINYQIPKIRFRRNEEELPTR